MSAPRRRRTSFNPCRTWPSSRSSTRHPRRRSHLPGSRGRHGVREPPHTLEHPLPVHVGRAGRTEHNITYTRQISAAMKPWTTGGAYLNFLGDEGQQRIATAFGPDKYPRLQNLKAKYDPTNLFRHNQNIQPSTTRAAMFTLSIEHAITDYPTWKVAFDRFAAAREQAGVLGARIRRPVDDRQHLPYGNRPSQDFRSTTTRPNSSASVSPSCSCGAAPMSWSLPPDRVVENIS